MTRRDPRSYWLRLALAVDRLGNALLFGDDRETFSERAIEGRARGERWARVMCAVLEWLDPGHCGGPR